MSQSSNKQTAKTAPALRSTPLWVVALACVAAASLSFVAMAALFGHAAPTISSDDSRPAIVGAHSVATRVWPTDTPDPAALNFPRISAATLKQLLDEHAPLQLLDNSTDDEYAAAHIPLAVHFQINDLLMRQGELDAGRPVILYCNCTAEQVSISFGRALQVRGFSDVRALSGGLKAWQAADYPTTSGSK
jgi:rhodanese-related sulfurtransferase